jgi:UDP-glucose 4-epimerase
MKIFLVTGAAGFIGAAVARKLIDEGHKVITIDNLSTGYQDAIPEGVEFFKGDCQDYSVIKQLEKFTFEAIIHIAGQSSGEISFDDPVYDLQTNAQSTLLLLKLAIKTKCTNFIYASTMSVYGDKPDGPVKEDTELKPKSFYGVGKLASEHYLRIYSEYGINSTALRLFNVYGPGQNMDNLRQGMVSIFLAQALKNKHIVVKGSAERYRDFVFIDDVVKGFIKAYNSNNHGYKYFNLATGIKTAVGEVVEIIKSNLPFDVSVEFSGATQGDQFGIYADILKVKKELDWEPSVKLNDGLSKMVHFHQGL